MTSVLIVEDDPMVAQINKNYIESVEGFNVVNIIKDANNAIDYLRNHKVDLIILDIYLPKGDGISILKQVREMGIKLDAIMVTAATESEKIEDALRYGAIDYLIKPFEYERLKRILEKYQRRHILLNSNEEMKQKDIDKITISDLWNVDNSLQKGLNRHTYNHVIKFVDENAHRLLSTEELSDGLGITKVTVRRYMDHLEKIGFVVQELEYGCVGRPSYKYKKALL